MKQFGLIALYIAGISFILGLFSRVIMSPLNILPGGLTASDFMEFTVLCLLASIALSLADVPAKKK